MWHVCQSGQPKHVFAGSNRWECALNRYEQNPEKRCFVFVEYERSYTQLSVAGRGTIIPGLLRRIPSELRS